MGTVALIIIFIVVIEVLLIGYVVYIAITALFSLSRLEKEREQDHTELARLRVLEALFVSGRLKIVDMPEQPDQQPNE